MDTSGHTCVGGDLVTEPVAAEHIARSVRTLQQWRYRGEGPPYVKVGRAVRYSLRDLDTFLAAHRVEPTPRERRPRRRGRRMTKPSNDRP